MSKIPNKKIANSRNFIKSPLNYIGGKYKLLPQLFSCFPDKVVNFVDLFAGGFNVGINVNAEKVYLNDNLTHLVEMYESFKSNSTDYVIKHINKRISKFNLSKTNTEGYLSLRDEYNKNRNPLDLFVLTAHSFNHQIRFNNGQQFNNPFGRNRSSFNEKMQDNLLSFLKEFRNKEIVISNACFEDFDFSSFSKGDYVYCDPPYLITTGTYNDGKRGFKGWSKTEEVALLDKLDELHNQGIGFGLSNVTDHKGRENTILKEWISKNKNYRVYEIKSDYKNSSYKNSTSPKHESIEVFVTNIY
jgi:DNA adenine methylase